jgi:hypothetical protein
MNWIVLIFWAAAGFLLALVFLLMQLWSVNKINPDRKKQSKRLVIGGAILRWIAFSVLIIFALQQSFSTTLVAFIAFMITRTLLLPQFLDFPWLGQEAST